MTACLAGGKGGDWLQAWLGATEQSLKEGRVSAAAEAAIVSRALLAAGLARDTGCAKLAKQALKTASRAEGLAPKERARLLLTSACLGPVEEQRVVKLSAAVAAEVAADGAHGLDLATALEVLGASLGQLVAEAGAGPRAEGSAAVALDNDLVSALHGALASATAVLASHGEPVSAPEPTRFNLAGSPGLAAVGALSLTAGKCSAGCWDYPVRQAALACIQAVIGSQPPAEVLQQLVQGVLGTLRSPALPGGAAADLGAIQALLCGLEAAGGFRQLRVLEQQAPQLLDAAARFATSRADSILSAGPGAREALLAAAVGSLRALESLVARDTVFRVRAPVVASLAALPGQLLQPLLGSSFQPLVYNGVLALPPGGLPDVSLLAGLFSACCGLLNALVRHRLRPLQRCMVHLIRSCTYLLAGLLVLEAQGSGAGGGTEEERDLATQCATELARVYESVGAQKASLGKYCAHLLADYVTYAATPFQLAGRGQELQTLAFRPAVARALRQGGYYLFHGCSPQELQQVHVSLGSGFNGSRRVALADLKADYERVFKYTGKV